jgi:hypothetical protein
MDRLLLELVALAGPLYLFLQIIMAIRYRGRWRLAALAPLLVGVPLVIDAGLAYAAGAPGWPTLLILVSPGLCFYLLLLALLKGWTGSAKATGGR